MEVSLETLKKTGDEFRALSFLPDGSDNKIIVFNNENNDLNPLATYYFSFLVHLWMFIGFLTHLCWFYFRCIFFINFYGPVDVCLLGVGNGGIGVGCWMWSELLMKTPQLCPWRRSGVFVICLGHVLRYLLLFPFLALACRCLWDIICCK